MLGDTPETKNLKKMRGIVMIEIPHLDVGNLALSVALRYDTLYDIPCEHVRAVLVHCIILGFLLQ